MSEIIVKQGQLEKEGGGAITRWQTRYFTLTRAELTWFKPEDLANAAGSIKLREITDVKRQVGERQGRKHVVTVCIAKKTYHLAAPNAEEQAEWIAALHPNSQASFASKSSGAGAAASNAPADNKADEVLAKVKAAAAQLKGSGESDRRATILIPIKTGEDQADGGGGTTTLDQTQDMGLTSPTSPSGMSSSETKYSVVEVFITKGLRVSGPVSNQMLTMLGQGVARDQKHLDERGWYCDKHFTLCAVMQTFVTNGWVLHRLSHSTSFTPWETSTLLPVSLVIFARGGGIKPMSMSESDIRNFMQSSITSPAAAASKPAARPGQAGGGDLVSAYLTPSEEAELQLLMEEFEIPLSLLEVPPVQ